MRLSPRRPVLVAALAAASVLGFAATAVLAPVPAVRADDTADQIAQLWELVKAGDDGKIIAKITELEAKLDPAVTEALLKLARTTKSDRVFKTAIKICAMRKDSGTFTFLKSKLKDEKMAEDHPERFFAVLDSLAFFGGDKGDKAVMKGLEDVVKTYLPKNSGITTRAIAAYGVIREYSVVDQLIVWLVETERTKGGGGSGTGGKGGMGAETRKLYDETKPAVLKALVNLTGQSFAAGPDWQQWWKDCKEKCEWPSAEAAVEPDWATLPEYVDKGYGFTLKKPEDGNKFWRFVKPEEQGQRAQLENRDEAGMLNARAKVYIYSGGTYPSPEAFAKYFMDLSFTTETDFEVWSKGGEAKIEEKTIGGRKFSVLSGKGKAKGGWKNWDAVERRMYITSPSAKVFLYFDCAVRTAWEQPLIDSFWKNLEAVVFKTPQK